MPDSQGNFLGDRATVLPNNTDAMLHFSDQFIQMEQQRKAKKEQEQKLEQDRHGRIQKLVNDNIYNPDYLKNDATNPLMQKSMSDWAAKVESDYNQYGETAAYDTVNKGAADIASGAQRIAETNKNLIQSVAQHKALHPDFESEKAINAMATSAWYKTDEKGNSVHKSLAEINPTEDYLGNLNKEHKDDYYPEEMAGKSMDNYLDKQKESDVNINPTYKTGGFLNTPGASGKAPTFFTIPVLENGQYKVETRSENYKLPGSSSDYLFDGKPIKVLPKNVFDDVYNNNDSARASINRKVKAILAQPVKDANGQEVQYGPDSEYAKMLTQKLAFDAIDAKVKNRYTLKTIDESDKMKREAMRDNIAKGHLQLSQHGSNRADEFFNYRKNRDKNNDESPVPVDDFLKQTDNEFGVDAEVEETPQVNHWFKPNEPATYSKKRIIPANVDPRILDLIAGKPNAKGVRRVGPQSFTDKNGQEIIGYEYDAEKNSALGSDNQQIHAPEVQREYLKTSKNGKLDKTPAVAPKKANNPVLTGNVR